MLSHEVTGSGLPVVLLHAFPLSGRMWRPQTEALKNAFRFIIPDLPGFGKSSRQETPSIAGMALEVARLLDHLGIREPVFIGGLSMGGYAAFEFYRQFPERVKALGLFSTRAAADTPEGRAKRMKTIEMIRSNGLEPFTQAVIPNLLGKTTLTDKAQVSPLVKEIILANDPAGVADSLLAMAQRRDSSDLLPVLKIPVLVAAGDEDLFIPFAEAQAMQKQIPGAVFELIARAGHLINLEDPEKFNAALKRFLDK